MRELKEFHLWDFPDNIYVLLKDDFRDNFFKELYSKFGSRRQYALKMGVSPPDVRRYHQGFSIKNSRKFAQYIPNWLIKKSLVLLSEEAKDELEKNITALRSRAGSDLRNPILPIRETPAIYRVLAHMIGDGSAGKGKMPYYANICKELREQFKKDLLALGEMGIYERIPNTVSVVYFPKVVTDVLSFVFNVRFTYPDRLPELLFSASDDCKIAFVRALFDDEGTASTNVSICIHNERILLELKIILLNFGINTSKITKTSYLTKKEVRIKLEMHILMKDISSFQTLINFSHPGKRRNLSFIFQTKLRNKIQRTRSKVLIEQQILHFLREKPHSTLELTQKLLLTINGLYSYLNKLVSENKIMRKGFKNKAVWYLV
jgi:hypothetical protein